MTPGYDADQSCLLLAASMAAVGSAIHLSPPCGFAEPSLSGVRLMSPDALGNVRVLRLDIEARLAANDIKERGYAEFAIDGKTLVSDNLKP